MKTAHILFTAIILRNGSRPAIPLRSIPFIPLRILISIFLPAIIQNTLYSGDSIPETTLLPEFEVISQNSADVHQEASGEVKLTSKTVLQLGRTLGEADFIAGIKRIAGITTAGDYGSGVSVYGALPSQTLYRIDGIPVIFPYRFGGVFSTFNTTHFDSMTFTPTALPVVAPQRIGAMFDFYTSPREVRKVSGAVNIGLLASSATLRLSTSPRYYIAASARISYIDQLYRGLLHKSSSYMSYRFYDLNLTAAYSPTDADILTFNFFTNADDLSYTDRNYDLTSAMAWQNLSAGITWRHSGHTDATTRGYFAGFDTKLSLDLIGRELDAPSRLRFGGIETELNTPISPAINLQYGAQLEWGNTQPQYVWLDNSPTREIQTGRDTDITADNYHYALSRGFIQLNHRLSGILTLEGGISLGGVFSSGTGHKDYHSIIADPRLTLRCNPGNDRLTFNVGLYTQYLHNVGFSDLGLASDFWLAACKDTPVQRALTWSARWFRPIGVAGLNLSLDTYFSLTFNQPEFNGNLLDAIDIEYSPFMFLTRMRGYNWGASIQVGRSFGSFTGNLAYSYGLGRTRTYEQGAIYHPAANEPGNTLNITLGWSRRHWQLNAAFRYADGRRYTPIEALYIIGGNLAMKYGTRNSGRLPSYQRLDLSATYTFQSGGRIPLTHLVNISLINAYGHRNTEMQYFVIDDNTGNYKLKRLNSMYRFLPSVSYTIQF